MSGNHGAAQRAGQTGRSPTPETHHPSPPPRTHLAKASQNSVGGFRLSQRDIDHVLLGPGGAYAFETKWSSSWESEYGRRRLTDAVGQATAGARTLRLWQPFKTLGIEPHPVVVLWGRGLANGREKGLIPIEGVAVGV